MTRSMHYGTFNTKDDTISLNILLRNDMGLGSTRRALG